MELSHLLKLVAEIPNHTQLNYVRGTDECVFIDVDVNAVRINAKAPNGDSKSWAPSYLEDLAPKIFENEPFNLSGLLNNKGSYRPVLETIIAHTREFYWVRRGTAIEIVWIPSMPKSILELKELSAQEIPAPKPHGDASSSNSILDKDALIPKVREAFMTFWSVVKPNLDNIPLYVQKFEDVFNPAIEGLGLGISSIFEILDGQQFDSIVGLMVKADPSLNYIVAEKNSNGHGPGGDNYYIWSSHRRYKDFLKVLAISDFRANIDKQKERNVQMATLSADHSQLSYLRAMRTKPFLLLAGISGTGKSRIVKQMAFDSCLDVGDLRTDPTSPGNYCLIEVKPNWHDSTELLGYESKIGGAHYQLTTFVKFLAKAMLFPDVPFFVCLDEMNLAPVEQYFAEFLSVLESRTKKNGHVVSEPLIKSEIFRKYSSLEKSLFSKEEDTTAYQDSLGTVEPEAPYGKEAQVFAHLKEHGLRIPENVVIIGTVNMDETTHQFSRKVIDRAMTIEMNLPEGDPFMDFFENSSSLEYREEPSSASLYLSTEVRAADVIEILTSESEEETESLKHKVANFLRGLNAALDKTPFQVAYRVQNELVLYFYQLWLEDKSVAWSDILTNACDQILMMKVLPRIEGDEELLEEPLKRLSEFCQPYTNASKKLTFMTERLAQSRFASFWP